MPEDELASMPGAGGRRAIAASGRRFPGDQDAPVGQIAGCRRGDCGRSIDSVCDSSPRHPERARSLVESAGPRKTRLLAHKLADRVALERLYQEAESPRARKSDGKS